MRSIMWALMLLFCGANVRAAPYDVAEKCEILNRILGYNESLEGALGKMSCVLNNEYRNGKVVIEVNIVDSKQKGSRKKKSFLKKNDTCGGSLVPVQLSEMRKKTRDIMKVMVVNMRVLNANRIEFYASLRSTIRWILKAKKEQLVLDVVRWFPV